MFIQINLLKVYLLNIYYSKDEKEKKKLLQRKRTKATGVCSKLLLKPFSG